jgi:hypothetical protein
MYMAATPNAQPKKTPPLKRSASTSSSPFPFTKSNHVSCRDNVSVTSELISDMHHLIL